MKASELMLGDLVFSKSLVDTNWPCRIYSIEGRYPRKDKEYDNQYKIDIWVGDGMLSAHIEDIQPIPLTEEILKANGFEKIDGKFSCFNTKEYFYAKKICESHCYSVIAVYLPYFEIRVKSDDESDKRYYCHDVRSKATYAHEFQHALRLCGLNNIADNFKII